MPDFRAYCQPPEREPSEILLSADESRHLVAVNRAKAGDMVVAFDGHGNEWICELAGDRKASALLKVRFHQKAQPLPYEITLGQALPKGPFMEAIVRKATELGAARIAPLESERTVVHLEGDRTDRRIEKWQLAAIEAAKQCGNSYVPEILPLQSATDFIDASRDFDLKLIASLQPGAKSLKSVLSSYAAAAGRPPHRVLWLVGPEGDFTPAEIGRSKSAGFEPITLGPLVLRCETAAIYALSVLSYELQSSGN